MKKLICCVLLGLATAGVHAAGPSGDFMDANVDVSDTASLQRGANLFANNCMGCHSAEFVRWNALPEGLGVSMELIEENLIFGSYEVGDMMMSAMGTNDSMNWFGAPAPDLSLTARSKGPDWIFTYLNSFYRDPDASIGWNNTLLENSSMPHVLWHLQGVPEPVREEQGGELMTVGIEVPASAAGTMTEAEYLRATRDITNFMTFLGEPVRAKRHQMGVWVIGFLVIFTFLAYLMKREYWRDIH